MPESRREIVANVDRLKRLMDRDGLDAIVARSGTNFTYLTGFYSPGTLGRHLDFPDSPRETLVVWPRRGEPVMILNHMGVALAKRDSWLPNVELYEPYAESPYETVANVVSKMGLKDATIGVETTYLSAARWEELKSLLPKARFIDCVRTMDEVRWVKTPAEVELLTEAANILDEAYLEVFSEVREGDTERAVHSRIVGSCLRRGARYVHGLLNCSRNPMIFGGESDMRLQKGDVILNDYTSIYKSYTGHQNRTVVIGAPSDDQKRTYRGVRDLYRSTIDLCVPGATVKSIFQYAAAGFRGLGFEERIILIGHGVGAYWMQQEPYFVRESEHVLEEGMVVAMEPGVSYWRLQDLVHVTEDGPKLLSTRFNTDEMFVAG